MTEHQNVPPEMGEVVLADDEMVERVATAMHNRVEAPHSIFWQSWETQTEFNRQCARRWVKDVLTVTQSVLGGALATGSGPKSIGEVTFDKRPDGTVQVTRYVADFGDAKFPVTCSLFLSEGK